MLINTTYKTNIQVTLSLEFDDNTTKKGTLEVGDIVKVTYRKDHRKYEDTGKIINVFIFANGLPTNRETVVFEFDFSDDYDSKKRRIPVYDIIDFTIIKYANGSKPEKPPCKPPKPPCRPPMFPDWPIPVPPCPPPDHDDTGDDNTGDDLGHHYTHHTHSCVCRPCPPPRPLKMRSFYVGIGARVGRSKVL